MASDEEPKTRTRKRRAKHRNVAFASKSVEASFPVLKTQASRQEVDEFAGVSLSIGGGQEHSIIEPVYPPQVLNRYAMSSGVLRTCIEAMATNIDGFGYTLEYIGPEDQRERQEVVDEYNRVRGVLDHPNGEYSLTTLRKRYRVDRESAGYGTMEIIRNEDDGFPDLLYHVPSHTVRMTTPDRAPTQVLSFLPRPGSRANNMLKVSKRFRRAVQVVNGKPVFFKECGDTRKISAHTGTELDEEGTTPAAATEILLDYIYSPGSRYGAPRWIGDLRSVLGIQESENVNLGYFKDNGIPAMMVFVLGGALTQSGMDTFEESIRSNRGQAMQQKVALIEVEGDPEAASEEGVINRPDVKVQSLTRERQTDAFFQEFESNAAKKVRSSFRLPAMFTGLTEEVRYAVAEASLTIAENQVFGPERAQTDDLFNYHILTYNGEPMRYWRFRSNPPRISNEAAVLEALSVFNEVGAMTPNIAIGIANEMFDMQIPHVEEDWGDEPFEVTLAAGMQTVADKPGEGDEGSQAPATKAEGVKAPRTRKRRPRRVFSNHMDTARVSGVELLTKGQTRNVDGTAKPLRVRRRVRRTNAPGSNARQTVLSDMDTIKDGAGDAGN